VKLFIVLAPILAMTIALSTPSQARYYQPETGRYLTADPIGLEGGIDPFVYVDNNPVNRVDPKGTDVIILPVIVYIVIPGAIIGWYVIHPPKPLPDIEAGYCLKSHKAQCANLYVKCYENKWGGDWRCEACRKYCDAQGEWPFEHCSRDLPYPWKW